MATVTPNVAQVFPVGTSVGAYLASGWPATAIPPSGAPVPSATESQTVASDGTLTFTTLAAGTVYFLGANLTPWRYMKLTTPGGSASPKGTATDPLFDDTELPAAVALSDTDANGAVPSAGARGMLWDDQAAKWVRARPARPDGGDIPTGVVAAGLHVFDSSNNWRSLRHANQVTDNAGGDRSLSVVAAQFNGAGFDRPRTPNVFKPFASTSITAGTPLSVWTPTSGKKFRFMGITFSISAASQLLICDNANGAGIFFRSGLFAAAGVLTIGAADLGNGFLSAAANNVLKLDVSVTAAVGGTVWGTEE